MSGGFVFSDLLYLWIVEFSPLDLVMSDISPAQEISTRHSAVSQRACLMRMEFVKGDLRGRESLARIISKRFSFRNKETPLILKIKKTCISMAHDRVHLCTDHVQLCAIRQCVTLLYSFSGYGSYSEKSV